MILYHGTNETSAISICESGIDFTKSKKELDFGIGFYLTDDISVAEKRAHSQTRKYNRIHRCSDLSAIVYVNINEAAINNLVIKSFEYCDEKWLTFVLANRLSDSYLKEHNILNHNHDLKYDVVKGSIADADISEISNHIENGDLTFDKVSVYDVLTNKGTTLGWQMSLHTENALKAISSRRYEIIRREDK